MTSAASHTDGAAIRSNKTIALTGGAGRVGRGLRTQLVGKVAAVRIIDITDPGELLPTETWAQTDITDLAALTSAVAGVDAIVHLAGYPNERTIEEILRVNVLGTHNIFEAARIADIPRVVLGSSNHVTGLYPRDSRISPKDPMRPDSLYGLSKCWGELEANMYYEKAGIRTLNIRIGNAGQNPTDARARAIWLSPTDLAQLVLIGLEHPDIRCDTVFAASETGADWWDNTRATELGYKPVSKVPPMPAQVPVASAAEQSNVAEYFQGGRFCVPGHDGTIRPRRRP